MPQSSSTISDTLHISLSKGDTLIQGILKQVVDLLLCRPNEVIDATVKGGLARFINHSCEPNCATQKWLVDGELRVGIFAKKRILAGAEITYDYQLIWNQGQKVKWVSYLPLALPLHGYEDTEL